MSKDKQSSVEWLVKELNQKIDFIPMNKWDEIKEVIEQAKAMHKDEGVDLYVNGMYKGQELYFGEDKIRLDVNSLKNCEKSAEQYYNETFGGNK